MDILFIKDLALETLIGVYPWEQQLKQTLLLDIEIHYDSTKAANSDDLKDALDYDILCKEITSLVTSCSFALIETVANKVADYLAEKTKSQITVTLQKPKAIKNARTVGIIVTRG